MKHRIINPEHETLLWEKEIHENNKKYNKEDCKHKNTHTYTVDRENNEHKNSIEVLGQFFYV